MPGKLVLIPGYGPIRKNKYNAKRVFLDNMWFDSRKEASRYEQLKIFLRKGLISGLRVHPRYPLVVNGTVLATYKPDFVYVDIATGKTVAEDVKSKMTKNLNNLRIRLFKALYPNIDFRLVM